MGREDFFDYLLQLYSILTSHFVTLFKTALEKGG